MDARTLILTGPAPLAIAAIILGAAWLTLGRKSDAAGPRCSAPLAFALALLTADYAVRSAIPDLWPVDSTARFPHAIILLAALGLAEALGPRRADGRLWLIIRHVFHFAGGAAVVWALLDGLHPHALSTTELSAWTAAGGVAITTLTAAMDSLAEAGRGWRFPALTTLLALGAANALFWADYATVAQVAGGLAAASLGAAGAGFAAKRMTLARGGTLVIAAAYVWLIAAGRFFGNLPPTAAALLLVAPFAAFLGRLTIVNSPRRRWLRPLTEALATAAPLIAAGLLAYLHEPSFDY